MRAAVSKWGNVLHTNEEIYRLKRAAVLREANRIMGRAGFHSTSLDEIAQGLGVSKGTLYNYVTDKQEILYECHMMALDIGEQAFEFGETNGKSGFGKLRLMLRAFIVWMNSLMGGGVMSEVTALRPRDRKIVIERRDNSDARMIEFIDEGLKDGSIRDVDPKMAVFAIMGAVNAIPTWYSPKGRLTPDQIADIMLNIFGGGLATKAASDADLPVPSYRTFDELTSGKTTANQGPRARRAKQRDSASAEANKPPSSDRQGAPAGNRLSRPRRSADRPVKRKPASA